MINGLCESKTFRKIEYCHDLPRGQGFGCITGWRKTTYPCYGLQRIINAALGALACYYLYPKTLSVALLSVGSVFATLGFGLGIYAIVKILSTTPPLLGYKHTELSTEKTRIA